jgi:20S proteasome alpha/beta subunit
MYGSTSTQERQHKDFFYPKETMGTTIMAIKYDQGVIACADSSTSPPTQEHPQVAATSLIESLIK